MDKKFTIFPNRLFYTNDDEISLHKQCKNYKILLVLDYLYNAIDKKGFSKFTIEDIITTYGYKLNRREGKINDNIKVILKTLQQNKIICSDKDISMVSVNEFVKCIYNGIEKDDNDNYIKFTMVYNDIINKILSYNKTKVDNLSLLFYYCYLNCRMYRSSNSHGKGYISGGKPEECHPTYKIITNDIDIKDSTIKKYNDILVNMNLIRIGNLGLCYSKGDEKNIKESPNFYVLVEEGNVDNENAVWKWNLKEGMKAYKNNNPNLVFLDTRQYKDNDKSKNGYIARITQLEKEGKATKKQIEKRDKLISEKQELTAQQ